MNIKNKICANRFNLRHLRAYFLSNALLPVTFTKITN